MSIDYVLQEIPERGIARLALTGELDFEARADFQAALQELGASSMRKLVIDIGRLSRLSSLFIGSLIDFGHTVQREGRSLAVMMPEPFVRACKGVGLETVAAIIPVKGRHR